jgi:hypothetical protein
MLPEARRDAASASGRAKRRKWDRPMRRVVPACCCDACAALQPRAPGGLACARPAARQQRRRQRVLRAVFHAAANQPPFTRLQLLTSHRATQLEPWFLKINGAATVPALVHAGKKLGSSGEICKYVAKLPGGPALTSADDDKFLKLCADVAHEDLVNAYLLKTGNTGERAERRTLGALRRKSPAPRHRRP